jgi:hypothetical protein
VTTVSPIARFAVILLLCLAVTQFVMQASLLANGVEYIAASLTNDDTYYYLQTAWQTKECGFVTFDGINRTNGVQLLWFWVVYVLSVASQTKLGLLHAALILCFALNVFCYFAIWRLAVAVRRPALAVLIGGLWSTLVADGTYWLALENSLHAFVFWCVVWLMAEFFDRLKRGQRVSMLPLTIALVLNVWTRLDAGVFSVVVYVVCAVALARGRTGGGRVRRVDARQLRASMLVGGLGAAVAMAAFYMMGGSVIPVSALIKLSSQGGPATALRTARQVLSLSSPAVLPHRLSSLLVKFSVGLTSLVIVGAASVRRSGRPLWPGPLRATWLTLAVSAGIYCGAIAVSGARNHAYFVWHRSPLFITWIITVGGAIWVITTGIARVVARALGRGPGEERTARDREGRRGVDWTVAFVGVIFIVLSFVRLLAPPSVDPTSMLDIRYRAALWMGANLPRDSRCAAWNAGQLGFYSSQAVINLDGLINSVEYYENVLNGPQPLTDYLLDNRVRYIVDYSDNELTAGLETIHEFPVDALGGRLRVWRLPWGAAQP